MKRHTHVKKPAKTWSLAAGLGALALILTSCTGNAQASPDETSLPSASVEAPRTPSPAPTPDPEPTPASADGPARNIPVPAMPEAAREESPEGLEAFLGYWLEQLSQAYESGDLTAIESITGEECGSCNNFFDSITDRYANGGWISGGDIVLESFGTTFEKRPDESIHGYVEITQGAGAFYNPDGSVSTDVPAETERSYIVFFATYESGAWTLVDFGTAQ